MATAQTSHVTCNPGHYIFDPYSLDSELDNDSSMGSVGSLVEKQDLSPAAPGGLRGMRQPDGLLRKGMSQREVFGYLHGGKQETRAEKKLSSGGFKRDYESDRENQSPELYFRDNQRGADFSKSSLPERGRFDKCRIRPSAFKVVSGKSLLPMQGLSSAKGQKLSKSNGSLHTLLTQSSTSSSSQRGPCATTSYTPSASTRATTPSRAFPPTTLASSPLPASSVLPSATSTTLVAP
ncbi:hypothetical protein JRQ81_002770 [Phrynocephalus forsythii]|uniref:Uncharacterized protein n=1 Tax=Phrynocephalus forsythii TaxID=171643 RepID=A0A9Q0XIK2_9SAUR|nr:hypothetical protein JRQ81_002770 [Phrynocephalus forsythii]